MSTRKEGRVHLALSRRCSVRCSRTVFERSWWSMSRSLQSRGRRDVQQKSNVNYTVSTSESMTSQMLQFHATQRQPRRSAAPSVWHELNPHRFHPARWWHQCTAQKTRPLFAQHTAPLTGVQNSDKGVCTSQDAQ